MTHPTSEAQVRKLTERHRSRAVNDEVWQYVSDHAQVNDVLVAWAESPEEGQEALLGLIENIAELELLRAGTLRRPPREPQRVEPDERLKALSRKLAQQAAEEPAVMRFRAEVLGGQLLEPADVETWVKRQAEADGESTLYLGDVAVPPGHTVQHAREGTWVEPPLTLSRETPARSAGGRFLAYAVPGQRAVFRVPVAHGGTLDRLRQLGERLVHSYGWRGDTGTAQATLFILTGQPPYVPRATITWHIDLGSPVEGRITLDLDPTLGPAAVAKLYREARAQFPLRRRSHRYRPMNEKHARLAEWADRDGSWRERMDEWNVAYPEWAYTDARNFARDATHAARRLYGEQEAGQ